MPLRVYTNVPAINVRRILGINNRDLKTRIERLSSGLRINRAADDAAGLSVSEGMRAEVSGLNQAVRNAEHATNLIQTAEGALNEVNAILIRMRELSVQSASTTVNDDNRESLNAEYVQLTNEIDRIANVTSYNNQVLLKGYGNVMDTDAATSTALASTTTGVVGFQILGAASGTYLLADAAGDREITLGNGVATQTVDIGPQLDADTAGGVVATGSSIVANFDRLGVQLTLSGQKAAEGILEYGLGQIIRDIWEVQHRVERSIFDEAVESMVRLSRQTDLSPTFREGKVGGWREAFTEEHKEQFKEQDPGWLVRLGYETDDNW